MGVSDCKSCRQVGSKCIQTLDCYLANSQHPTGS